MKNEECCKYYIYTIVIIDKYILNYNIEYLIVHSLMMNDRNTYKN